MNIANEIKDFVNNEKCLGFKQDFLEWLKTLPRSGTDIEGFYPESTLQGLYMTSIMVQQPEGETLHSALKEARGNFVEKCLKYYVIDKEDLETVLLDNILLVLGAWAESRNKPHVASKTSGNPQRELPIEQYVDAHMEVLSAPVIESLGQLSEDAKSLLREVYIAAMEQLEIQFPVGAPPEKIEELFKPLITAANRFVMHCVENGLIADQNALMAWINGHLQQVVRYKEMYSQHKEPAAGASMRNLLMQGSVENPEKILKMMKAWKTRRYLADKDEHSQGQFFIELTSGIQSLITYFAASGKMSLQDAVAAAAERLKDLEAHDPSAARHN